MAVTVQAERTSATVSRMAAGPFGRALAGRPVRGLGRVVTLVIILLWSLFPIYWALNVSFSTLSGADSAPAHYFPSPLVGTSYRRCSASTAPATASPGSSAGRCSTR